MNTKMLKRCESTLRVVQIFYCFVVKEGGSVQQNTTNCLSAIFVLFCEITRCKKFHSQELKLSLHGGIRCELYYAPPRMVKRLKGSLYDFSPSSRPCT